MRNKVFIVVICFLLISYAKGFCFELKDKGSEQIVDYQKYGEFKNTGTFEYEYIVKDAIGLAKAQGIGIDPNEEVFSDSRYLELKQAGKLRGDEWKRIDTDNPELDFYKWASEKDIDPGIRLLFTARAFENAGLYEQAIKAYYAMILLYPNSFSWNRDRTWTWLVAKAAWDSLINIIRMHPEINLEIKDTFIKSETGNRWKP